MVIIKTSADEVSIHAVSPLSIFGGAAGVAAGAACWGATGATPVCGGVCAVSCAPIVSGESRQAIRAMRTKRRWILGCTIDPPRILCVEFEQRDLTETRLRQLNATGVPPSSRRKKYFLYILI